MGTRADAQCRYWYQKLQSNAQSAARSQNTVSPAASSSSHIKRSSPTGSIANSQHSAPKLSPVSSSTPQAPMQQQHLQHQQQLQQQQQAAAQPAAAPFGWLSMSSQQQQSGIAASRSAPPAPQLSAPPAGQRNFALPPIPNTAVQPNRVYLAASAMVLPDTYLPNERPLLPQDGGLQAIAATQRLPPISAMLGPQQRV